MASTLAQSLCNLLALRAVTQNSSHYSTWECVNLVTHVQRFHAASCLEVGAGNTTELLARVCTGGLTIVAETSDAQRANRLLLQQRLADVPHALMRVEHMPLNNGTYVTESPCKWPWPLHYDNANQVLFDIVVVDSQSQHAQHEQTCAYFALAALRDAHSWAFVHDQQPQGSLPWYSILPRYRRNVHIAQYGSFAGLVKRATAWQHLQVT